MNKKEKSRGTKYDGKSRVSNDLYRKNWNEIFKKGVVGKDVTLKETKKILKDIKEPMEEYVADEDLQKIIDRNGF